MLCVLPALYVPACQALALYCESHVTASRIPILDPADGITRVVWRKSKRSRSGPPPSASSFHFSSLPQKNKNKNKNNNKSEEIQIPLAQYGKFKAKPWLISLTLNIPGLPRRFFTETFYPPPTIMPEYPSRIR